MQSGRRSQEDIGHERKRSVTLLAQWKADDCFETSSYIRRLKPQKSSRHYPSIETLVLKQLSNIKGSKSKR